MRLLQSIFHAVEPGKGMPDRPGVAITASNRVGDIISESTHDRAIELHNLAAHAHQAAATAHGKGDHLSAHELTKKAHEHSWNAYKHAGELIADVAKFAKD
jgi:hypothetical protein